MRVLLFGPYPLPSQTLVGGATAVVQMLARGLARRPGQEVFVAAAQPGIASGLENDGPLTIHRLPVMRFRRLRWQSDTRRALVAVASAVQPDVIHAHGVNFYGAAALDAPYPSLVTVHGVIKREAALSGAQNLKEWLAWRYDALYEAWVLRRARHCTAISPYVRRAFAGYTHIAWRDIANPVEDDCFDLAPQPQPGRLLCPARVIPRKGIDTLIRAFACIAPDFPAAHLHIAGETETHPGFVAACRDLIAAAGLPERVCLLGNLARPDLLAAYQGAQAVVLAARQETAPVALAEAMAAGCPVVATAVGGVPDMVGAEQPAAMAGLLVPPDDVAALAQALAQALSDPIQATHWGQQARLLAQRFRLDAVVNQTMEAYREVIGNWQ
jgi:glycosyltransferase involved in cell wall biosynthesis